MIEKIKLFIKKYIQFFLVFYLVYLIPGIFESITLDWIFLTSLLLAAYFTYIELKESKKPNKKNE